MAASQASRGGTPGRRKAAAAGTLRGNAGRTPAPKYRKQGPEVRGSRAGGRRKKK